AYGTDKGMHVETGTIPNFLLTLRADLVHEGLTELLRNAIEAPRPDGRERLVRVSSRRSGRDVVIAIMDNGLGMKSVHPGTPLHDIQLETKARPAEGLA